MDIVGWILLGTVLGVLARLVLGPSPGGVVMTVVWSIIGAIAGGFVGRAIFGRDMTQIYHLESWLCAAAGSLVLVVAARALHRAT